jgi:hypothetical protein
MKAWVAASLATWRPVSRTADKRSRQYATCSGQSSPTARGRDEPATSGL